VVCSALNRLGSGCGVRLAGGGDDPVRLGDQIVVQLNRLAQEGLLRLELGRWSNSFVFNHLANFS